MPTIAGDVHMRSDRQRLASVEEHEVVDDHVRADVDVRRVEHSDPLVDPHVDATRAEAEPATVEVRIRSHSGAEASSDPRAAEGRGLGG